MRGSNGDDFAVPLLLFAGCGLPLMGRKSLSLPASPSAFHRRLRQNRRSFLGGGRVNGDNERRVRNPLTRDERPQPFRYGHRILCPHARGNSSRARKCADWCGHCTRNQKSQIRPRKAVAASLLSRCGACLKEPSLGSWSRNHSVFDADQCAHCESRLAIKTTQSVYGGVNLSWRHVMEMFFIVLAACL
jgi:hypothetical protein